MVSYAGKIRRYRGKVLFSGVFATDSNFQYRGIVMDENGRNGRKWHLAQQLAHHVIIQKKQQQPTQPVIKPHIMQLSMTQPVTFTLVYL